MLNMSTMSYVTLCIAVFQEQQNGETNISGLLTTSTRHWVICGGSGLKSRHSALWQQPRTCKALLPCPGRAAAAELPLSGDRATRRGHPCDPCPDHPSHHRTDSAHRLPTLAPLHRLGCKLLVSSAHSKFFYVKNHLSCYTTRQKSLRLW